MKQLMLTALQKTFVKFLHHRIILTASNRCCAVRTIQAIATVDPATAGDIRLTGTGDTSSIAGHHFDQIKMLLAFPNVF